MDMECVLIVHTLEAAASRAQTMESATHLI